MKKNGFKVLVKRVDYLTPEEYKSCYNLNLRGLGMMRDRLVRCRKNKLGWAFMIFDGDKLLSWALVFNGFNADIKSAYFYTRVNARGNGYASLIIEEIKAFTEKVKVYPWNNSTDRFFSKYSFDKSYTFWQRGEVRYAA